MNDGKRTNSTSSTTAALIGALAARIAAITLVDNNWLRIALIVV